jgi:hypothetical protein
MNETLNEDMGFKGTPAVADIQNLTSLLENTNDTLQKYGVDLEDPNHMVNIFNSLETAGMYIDSLAEGLTGSDLTSFKTLSKNMLDAITGTGNFRNSGLLSILTENTANVSAGFLPQAKVLFPMFRFTWPRLITKEFTTVMNMDSPEAIRYFFRAVAKTPDGSTVPLPSYAPIGSGQPIGTLFNPKLVVTPGSTDLLGTIGLSSQNATLEKHFIIVGWEGTDPQGNTINESTSLSNSPHRVVDEDGQFNFSVDLDPNRTQMNPYIETISGFVDFSKGIINVSGNYSDKNVGRVTAIKIVANASSSEYNQSARISFDNHKINFLARDVQLQAEWSSQYLTDMNKRTGMDVLAEFICVMGNQTQLTIDKMIIDDIIYNVSKYGGNIETFTTSPEKARSSFAYTRKEWANELLFILESVSAKIYAATNVMDASHILCNPIDLVWLSMLDNFSFNGDYTKDGAYGRSVAGTINNGKTVLCSPLLPHGFMLLGAKPSDITLANYIFAPYLPMTISPYPATARPAITFTTRFANEIVRPEGFGLVRLA